MHWVARLPLALAGAAPETTVISEICCGGAEVAFCSEALVPLSKSSCSVAAVLCDDAPACYFRILFGWGRAVEEGRVNTTLAHGDGSDFIFSRVSTYNSAELIPWRLGQSQHWMVCAGYRRPQRCAQTPNKRLVTTNKYSCLSTCCFNTNRLYATVFPATTAAKLKKTPSECGRAVLVVRQPRAWRFHSHTSWSIPVSPACGGKDWLSSLRANHPRHLLEPRGHHALLLQCPKKRDATCAFDVSPSVNRRAGRVTSSILFCCARHLSPPRPRCSS